MSKGIKELTRTRIKEIIVVFSLRALTYHLVFTYLLDTQSRRKAVAEHLRSLATQVKAGINRDEAFNELLRATTSNYDFEKNYAIGTLGRLEELAKDAVPTISVGLRSNNPYVRDASAHALQRIGKAAAAVKAELIALIYKHKSESAAQYAVECLGQLGDNGNDVLQVLEFAITAKDSMGRQEAEKAYLKLTGKHFLKDQ